MMLEDLRDLLSSGGVTTTIKLGLMDDTADAQVQLAETGGIFPLHAMSTGAGNALVERPRVQVTVRDAPYNYIQARITMNVAYRLLDGLPTRTINGTRYHYIEAVQAPFALPPDANDRPLIVCNFDVQKALSTSTST